MLTISLIVLASAAAAGLFLGLSKQVPGFMRLGHGALAGLGLALLLIAALGDGRSLVWTAFGLIAAGFAGGAVLFGAVFRDRKPPGFMIAGHGALNGLGVLVLAWTVLYPG